MGNRPYITAAQVRRSVLRRRALEAQAEAERSGAEPTPQAGRAR
jgi:hypothetical protein